MEAADFQQALLVDDDPLFRRTVQRVLKRIGIKSVRTAGSAAEALAKLHGADLLVVDICLPDGDCLPVVDTAGQMKPRPKMIAISGRAKREQVVQVLLRCIDDYLEKPVSPADLRRSIASLRKGDSLFKRQLRSQVGLLGMTEVAQMMRGEMFQEAVRRSHGSLRAAARLLGVDRRVVQRISAQQNRNQGE